MTKLAHIEFLLSQPARLYPAEIAQLLQEREAVCIALLEQHYVEQPA